MLERLLKIFGFAIGFGVSHYSSHYASTAGHDLILFNLIHIHHWFWGLAIAILLKSQKSFSRLVGLAIIALVTLLHISVTRNYHRMPELFWTVFIMWGITSIMHFSKQKKLKDYFFFLISWVAQGIAAEGLLLGYTELLQKNLTAFRIFLR